MLTNKKHLLLICTILFSLAVLVWPPGSANAQSESKFEWINVTLWPEYEGPSVLVVYEIHLYETLNFPQEVTLPVPADCQVEKVSIQRADGELLPIAWYVSMDENWQQVHFAAVSPVTVLQYQILGIEEENAFRKFSFTWLFNAAVDSFSLKVYQPYGASDLVIKPSLSQVEKLDDGRNLYSKDFGSIASDEEIFLDIQYDKDISNPDYPALSVSALSPIDETTPGHSATPLSVVVWLIAVSVVVMMMVAIYYWWISRRMRHKRDHIVRGVGILNPEKQAVFCHECGSRSKSGG